MLLTWCISKPEDRPGAQLVQEPSCDLQYGRSSPKQHVSCSWTEDIENHWMEMLAKALLFQGGQTGVGGGCVGGSLHPWTILRLCNLRNCSQITSDARLRGLQSASGKCANADYSVLPHPPFGDKRGLRLAACGRQAVLTAGLLLAREGRPRLRRGVVKWPNH